MGSIRFEVRHIRPGTLSRSPYYRFLQSRLGAACSLRKSSGLRVLRGPTPLEYTTYSPGKVSHFKLESKMPNKAPEPTPMAVTSPAAAGAAPAIVVAHLERWAKAIASLRLPLTVTCMPKIALPAHYDGEQIRLDEPYRLPKDA